MKNDKIKKYLIPNIPYLFILWACLKLGTAYRLAAGAEFAYKLLGLGQTIGPAFADFAPGLHPFDWLVGIAGAAALRLVVYAQEPESRRMVYSLSEDGGNHWTPMKPCGGDIVSVMPWTAILPIGDGRLVGLTNARDPESAEPLSNRIIRSYSCDNGLSWTPPEPVTHLTEANLCEPWVLPSPDGREWACLLRANNREYPSMVIFSRDHGATWSVPRPLPEGLRGDRHIARYLPDGRILAVFRNVAPDAAGFGHFCGWVGRWEDLKNGTPGELQLKLLHHAPAEPKFQFDCGYPGLELLPDGTVVAVTYLHRRVEDAGNSVVSMRIPSSQLTQEFSYEAAK